METYYDHIDGDVLVLAADGGLNSQTSEAFVRDLEKLIDAGLRRIIVDCSKLTHVSSYGIGILVRLHGHMKKRGGNVKICSVHGMIIQILQLARLDRVFEIYPDLDRARLAMRTEASET
ncbi:MAG: STAS domain-containing protein [Planctomycetota bacterium]